MRLVPLPVPLAPEISARVARWLDAACRRPGCDATAGELLASCARGEAQLIGIFDGDRLVAAGVTQVGRHGGGSLACWVLALGGRAAGPWPSVIAVVEAGARHVGCATVEFIGRLAWRRLLPDYAATPCADGVHFVKGLEP